MDQDLGKGPATRRRPLVLGLLGGIASGKSTVARTLAELGAVVLDADQQVGEVLCTPEVQKALAERFGPTVLDQGQVDRKVLSREVFGNAAALSWLEELLHPRVRARLEALLAQALDQGEAPAVVLDVPLLLERSAFKKHCDQFIFVDCPTDIRRKRAEKLRGWTAEEFDRREAHQWPPEEKKKQADVVFLNRSDEADLRQAILEWLERSGGFAGLPRRAGQEPSGRTHDDTAIPPADC